MSQLFAKVLGSGQPVICLHGLFGSADNLGMIMRNLAHDYEVHCLDLRNHGRSFHDDAMNYTVMAQDIATYMDTQNIEKAIIIGHSMGGKVAMMLALNYPERVNQLIVLDIAPVRYPQTHQSIFEGLKLVHQQKPESRQVADHLLQPFVENKSERSFLLKNLVKDPTENHYQLRIHLQSIFDAYNHLLGFDYTCPIVNVESLFIFGSRSEYGTNEAQAQIKHFFSHATIETIIDAGHWLHVENYAQVTDLIYTFLSKR